MTSLAKYCILNGDIIATDSTAIKLNNRAFRYGDALFETMHAFATEVQFLNHHLNRLKQSMALLKMEEIAGLNAPYLKEIIAKLLDKNKLYMGVRLRLTVFRNEGGYYTPHTNQASYLIESEPLKHEQYKLNEKGLQIDVYTPVKKAMNPLSNLKSANALLYVLAGIYKKENHLDDCLLLNEKGQLCEFVSANLFLAKNDILYTPPLQSGCVQGIMRNQIIRLAKSMNLKVVEKPLSKHSLLEADEVFSTNAIQGIQWISAYRQKRYFNRLAALLSRELNKMAFGN